jgi:hypothetical protein
MDRCICCGAEIPEGRQVCWNCENATAIKPDAILPDGTPLYLKTQKIPGGVPLQLQLYAQLMKESSDGHL